MKFMNINLYQLLDQNNTELNIYLRKEDVVHMLQKLILIKLMLLVNLLRKARSQFIKT